MANILLKDKNGSDVIYRDVASVRLRTEEGGFASFGEPQGPNIAYGDTPPEDTTKLWVKTSNPNKCKVSMFSSTGTAATETDKHSYNTNKLSNDYKLCFNSCAKVGSYVYSFGGYRYKSAIDSYKNNIIYKFTATALTTTGGTIEQISAYTAADGHYNCVAVGAKVYLFGGNTSTNAIRCFDTTSETITTLSAVLPKANREIGCAAVGTKIYLLGGVETPSAIHCFDTETGVVSLFSTTLAKPSHSGGCVAIGSRVYLIGGFNGGALNCIQYFDTEDNKAVEIDTKLQTARFLFGCAAVGEQIIIYGGSTGVSGTNYKGIGTIEIFNASDGSIRTSHHSTNYALGASCAVNPADEGAIVVMGGTVNAYTTVGSYPIGYPEYIWYFKPSQNIELEPDSLFIRCTSGDVKKQWEAIKSDTVNMVLTPQAAYRGNSEGVGKQVGMSLYVDGVWVNV